MPGTYIARFADDRVAASAVTRCHTACLPAALQFPSKLYYAARALAQPFNELVDAIARQPDWLFEVLERRVILLQRPLCACA